MLEFVSQVNRNCPPGQTDTIPNGDSVMDVPIPDNSITQAITRIQTQETFSNTYAYTQL